MFCSSPPGLLLQYQQPVQRMAQRLRRGSGEGSGGGPECCCPPVGGRHLTGPPGLRGDSESAVTQSSPRQTTSRLQPVQTGFDSESRAQCLVAPCGRTLLASCCCDVSCQRRGVAVSRRTDSSLCVFQAWQLLGMTQAENENEQAAIMSLQRSDFYVTCHMTHQEQVSAVNHNVPTPFSVFKK